jgi:AraC family transcriptional regulator, alkane utilization regulator
MDALSDVLGIVRLTGAVFMDAEFTKPWCISHPEGTDICSGRMPNAQHVVIYHLVTEGECEVALDEGDAPRSARVGDLIVIPGGQRHALGSDVSLPRLRGPQIGIRRAPGEMAQIRHGGGGAPTKMVCGYLACDSSLFETVLAPLPRVMVIGMSDGPSGQWLSTSIRFSLAEYASQRAGTATVLAKLSELMFVEAMRRHIESLPPDRKGWLAGLRDRYVGKSLALMHSQTAHRWTVDELASLVGLSRSALAERFVHLVGVSPIQYLTRWRLQLAADLLRSTRRSIAAIGAEVGYESEPGFSRAFKRETGETPAACRRKGIAKSRSRARPHSKRSARTSKSRARDASGARR